MKRRPRIEVDGRSWSIHHPDTDMVLRRGTAKTKRRARAAAGRAADAWSDQYGHL